MRVIASATLLTSALVIACGSEGEAPVLQATGTNQAGVSAGGLQLSADDRYIVEFDRSAARSSAISAVGAKVELEIPSINAVAITADEAALDALAKNPAVKRIEPDARRYPLAQVVPYGIDMVQAPLVSDAAASNTTVCIIDSGLALPHEDIDGGDVTFSLPNGSVGDPLDDFCGHGTHVAGTIAALDNSGGVVGVNPGGNLNVHVVKVFGDSCAWAYASTLAAALGQCVSDSPAGTQLVINMSLGGGSPSAAEELAFDVAYASGVLSIAAAGNAGDTSTSYPAGYGSVVSVAAVDSVMAHASFSQVNADVEISAPGVSVLSTMDPAASLYGGLSQLALEGAGLESRTLTGTPEGDVTAPSVDCGSGTGVCAGATGKVCLIARGTNTFAQKVVNCQSGGGVGAVIYNNLPGFFDGTLGTTITTIPSLATSDAIGAQLLAAVGQDVTVVIDASAPYTAISGTSMATPHVAGGAALLWSQFPSSTNQEIRDALTGTAVDLGAPGRDNTFGFGLMQLAEAYDSLAGGAPCDLTQLQATPSSPQAANTSVEFTAVTSGCTNPRFKFTYRLTSGGAWVTVQNGPDDSATIALPAGAYKVRAQVKEDGASGWAAKKVKKFTWL